jgi:hypothetical protein
MPYDPAVEDRLVAFLGKSARRGNARDDYRLKGWVGPTNKTYGSRRDSDTSSRTRLATLWTNQK